MEGDSENIRVHLGYSDTIKIANRNADKISRAGFLGLPFIIAILVVILISEYDDDCNNTIRLWLLLLGAPT